MSSIKSLVFGTSVTFRTLANNTNYFWRVNATNAGGVGAGSTINRYTAIVVLPAAVTRYIGDSAGHTDCRCNLAYLLIAPVR